MINLFDNYKQASRDLHDSLKRAGYHHPCVVIDDDGFLPEDILSPFTHFLGEENKQQPPLYFNQVRVPKFWEIKGTNTSAAIYDHHKKRANIFYAKPEHKRYVHTVEWLDDKQTVRSIDYYNQYGRRYAHTSYDSQQVATMTTYFHVDGSEVLVNNHITGALILTREGQTRVFASKVDYIHYFLNACGLQLDRIFYNTLGLAFLVTYALKETGDDILFWQEPIQDSIPGNMQVILDHPTRTSQIIVQDKAVYQRLAELVAVDKQEKITYLGYIYPIVRQNMKRQEALIFTNSDQIAHIREVVGALPDVTIHIAALTEMSEKLMALAKYANVRLYPNVSVQMIEKLWQVCDIYLDINYHNEILLALRYAFERNMLILAFQDTCHNRQFVAPEHIFEPEQVADMTQYLKQVLADDSLMTQAIHLQQQQANMETDQTYQQLLGVCDDR